MWTLNVLPKKGDLYSQSKAQRTFHRGSIKSVLVEGRARVLGNVVSWAWCVYCSCAHLKPAQDWVHHHHSVMEAGQVHKVLPLPENLQAVGRGGRDTSIIVIATGKVLLLVPINGPSPILL